MKYKQSSLIKPKTILQDALDAIGAAGSQIAFVVIAGGHFFVKLFENRSASPFYTPCARLQSPSRITSRLVRPCSTSCLNSPIFKNNHGAIKL